MFGKLLLIFIVVPLLDLFLLGVLSGYMGWPATILTVVVSGLVGAWLARSQSTGVAAKIQAQIRQHQMPGDLLIDGAMIMFAAGLLITPGVITDVVGLTILVPPCREVYKSLIKSYFKRHVKIVVPPVPGGPLNPNVVDGQVTGSRTAEPGAAEAPSTHDGPETIEQGDFKQSDFPQNN